MTFSEENKEHLDNAWKDYSYAIKKFDEQSLFISSGALALSLTFIKDIVPLKESSYIAFFYISIILFLLTIVLGFLSHVVSSDTNMTVYKMLLERKEIKEDDKVAIDKIDKKINNFQFSTSKTISRMNQVLTYSLIFGLISLVFYCIINILISRVHHCC